MPEIIFRPLTDADALYPLTVLENPENLLWGAAPMRDVWRENLANEVPQDQIQGLEIQLSPRLVPSFHVLKNAWGAGRNVDWQRNGETLLQLTDGMQPAAIHEAPDSWEVLDHPTDWFAKAGQAIDMSRGYASRKWQAVSGVDCPNHVTIIGPIDDLLISPGVTLTGCTLNTTTGPIYLGPGSEVQEGAHIRGPFILGEHSTIKMGAKIYGPTIVGPHCKVGGEVSNSVFLGFSNKGHDGFVGNSVIGRWCNLGADTNTSNLKNTYGEVKVYDRAQGGLVDSGLQFCGLIMGDHSKCGINTMFNTGTVVGIGCNIYDSGFPPKHVPNFSWGSARGGWVPHDLEKMLDTARAVLARRGIALDDTMELRIRAAHLAAFPTDGR